MTGKPAIINCDGVVFVTIPFPHGSYSELLPAREEQIKLGVFADVRGSNSNEYFTVTISHRYSRGQGLPRLGEQDEQVRQVLAHVWAELIDRDICTGPMPTIVKGNPLDMLSA